MPVELRISLLDRAATSGNVQVSLLPTVVGRDAASMGNKTFLTWCKRSGWWLPVRRELAAVLRYEHRFGDLLLLPM